jgi:uncharacterized protein (TIGR02117 family)
VGKAAAFLGLTLSALVLAASICRAAPDDIRIRVTNNGWHSGIVVSRADLAPGAIPEAADFPQANDLQFGWGNAEYYPTPNPGWGLTLRVALQRSPAVIHLAGLPGPAHEIFPTVEIVELRLTRDGFRRLLDYINASFDRRGESRASVSAPGLYAFSQFYPATGTFHMFNTCNSWTAGGIAAAGLPIQASGIWRAEDLLSELRRIAAAQN